MNLEKDKKPKEVLWIDADYAWQDYKNGGRTTAAEVRRMYEAAIAYAIWLNEVNAAYLMNSPIMKKRFKELGIDY